MKFRNALTRNFTVNGKIWVVKVNDTKGFDISFDTRKEAREYKRLLASSRRQINAQIIMQEFLDGYMEEKETA